jgi:4-amino-4-deoxy-L-arabinose transferase-like glycosyltransferase
VTTVATPPWAAPAPTTPTPTETLEDPTTPLVVGTTARARWELPALGVLLVATAVLYLWGLSASGWANSFYSAAAQAGSQSWKAFLFGSSDAANSITVDKPPMSLWPMALAVRIFGLSSWSILVPQALMGVGTVAIVFVTVRKRVSAVAGLLAGAAFAVAPVATLMFRFNNPDALLVLLMTASAATLLRAIDDKRARWMVATGVLIGFAFLTKQLQALLVVPGFAVVYLAIGPGGWWRRVRHLLLGAVGMLAGAGWWIAIVTAWPTSSRPYVGGSQTNSIFDLTLGYNGLGRITGNENGSVTGGHQAGWGRTGIGRLVDSANGGQIAWLLPAVAILGFAALWYLRRAPRTDARRAVLLVFGSWLLVTWLVFSYMQGIYHEYYTVALAVPMGVVFGAGAWIVWGHRREVLGAGALAAATVTTALWSADLLRRSPGWNSWLPTAVTVGGIVTAVALLAGLKLGRYVAAVAAVGAVVVVLAGPASFAVATAANPHTGSVVTAGPRATVGVFNGRFFPGFGRAAGAIPAPRRVPTRLPGNGGGPAGPTTRPTAPRNNAPTRPRTTAPAPRLGGLLGTSVPSAELRALLLQDADRYTWIAATTGSNNAAGYQLETQHPVMPVGGFNGSDPSPTLEQFQRLVAGKQIHWYLASGLERVGANGGSRNAAEIARWVSANFAPREVGGVTLYDLG